MEMPFIIVTELMEGGNLREWVMKNKERVTLGLILDVSMDICRGLIELHTRNIVHRDIKPDNILLYKDQDDSIHVKLAGI
jgi:serine/threonine protein kinase